MRPPSSSQCVYGIGAAASLGEACVPGNWRCGAGFACPVLRPGPSSAATRQEPPAPSLDGWTGQCSRCCGANATAGAHDVLGGRVHVRGRLAALHTTLSMAAAGSDRYEVRRSAEVGEHLLWDTTGRLQRQNTRTAMAGLLVCERLMLQLAHQVAQILTHVVDDPAPGTGQDCAPVWHLNLRPPVVRRATSSASRHAPTPPLQKGPCPMPHAPCPRPLPATPSPPWRSISCSRTSPTTRRPPRRSTPPSSRQPPCCTCCSSSATAAATRAQAGTAGDRPQPGVRRPAHRGPRRRQPTAVSPPSSRSAPATRQR